MNQTVKLIVIAAFAETALAAAVALAWAAHRAGGLDVAHLHRSIPPLLWMSPLALGAAGLIFWRRLANRPELPDRNRAYLNSALLTGAIASALTQNLFVYGFAIGWQPDREVFVRLAIAGFGVWMIILGNSLAKLDPPIGDAGTRTATWTRSLLRMGWATVIWGIAAVAVALVAPLEWMRPFVMVLVLAIVSFELIHRRTTKGQNA
jgi:hypothetical protein